MRSHQGFPHHLPEQDRLLFEAVKLRDLAAVQQQLAAGADVAAADEQGFTPLHVATDVPHEAISQALLAVAANGPATDRLGFFLRLAAAVPQAQVVQALLAARADASARTRLKPAEWSSNATPLQLLAMGTRRPTPSAGGWGCVDHSAGGLVAPVHKCDVWCEQRADMVQQLAAAGAAVDVAAAGKDCKRTPLHFAAAAGCSTVVSALLRAGADPGATTPSGYTVLHAAASSGRLEVVQQLLGALGSSRAAQLVNLLGQEVLSITRARPLQLAAADGYPEVVEALLAAGADKEQPDDSGDVALHHALRHGHCHLVPLLVTPATANKPSEEGDVVHRLPLHMAAVCPKPHRLLAGDPQRKQPLVAAAAEAVGALLAAGADPLATDVTKQTALALAAEGEPQVFQVLLRRELLHLLQQQRQQQEQQPTPTEAQQQQQQQPALTEAQQQQPAPTEAQQQQQQPQNIGLPERHPLRDVSIMALCWQGTTGWHPMWTVLVTEVIEHLGEAGLRALWTDLQQVLLHPEQQAQLSQGAVRALRGQFCQWSCARDAWVGCWRAACAQHAKRDNTRKQLQQLFGHPQQPPPPPQQQQQQGRCAGAGRPIKRPRLARELRLLQEQAEQQPGPANAALSAAAADAPCCSSSSSSSSSSSRAARAESRQVTKALPLVAAAATDGSLEGVLAVLEPLTDKAAGLSAGVVAACRRGHRQLCMQLLRQLMMLDAAEGWTGVQRVHEELTQCEPLEDTDTPTLQLPWQDLQVPAIGDGVYDDDHWSWQEHGMRRLHAALRLCDALLEDWLAVRRLQVQGLAEAVVAAVATAAAV